MSTASDLINAQHPSFVSIIPLDGVDDDLFDELRFLLPTGYAIALFEDLAERRFFASLGTSTAVWDTVEVFRPTFPLHLVVSV
jgi:hypothetical protein